MRTEGRAALGGITVLLLALSAAAEPAPPAGDAACGDSCDGDPTCTLERASCLLAEGEHRGALDELKAAHEADVDDGRLVRMMALVYLDQGNAVWAVKRLLGQLERQPGDRETRAWAVWVLVREGDLPRATSLLEGIEPGDPDEHAQRISLLRAALADLQGDRDDAEAQLAGVMQSGAPIHAEDRVLLDHLRGRIRGDLGDPLSARIQLSGGYTSNAVQSSPTDPGATDADGATGSPLLGIDAVVRLEPWTSRWVRPTGELRVRAQGQLSEEAADLSYADLGGRAGVDLGHRGPHLSLAHSGELLAVHGGDAYQSPGPRWFMEAHRAELEFLPVPELQLFAGAGRRIYRELPRTRTEVDGGLALLLPLPGGWNLTGIAAGRVQNARHEAYDGFGVTGLVRIAVPLPGRAMLKVKAMVVGDRYPDSAAYYSAERPRDDLLFKAQVGPWSPPLGGFRLGLAYTFSGRHSTVEDYAYTDHRVLFEVRWTGALDPAAPRASTPSIDHLALPYGLGSTGDSGLDRVQDLLRQEDSARRGSSCVD